MKICSYKTKEIVITYDGFRDIFLNSHSMGLGGAAGSRQQASWTIIDPSAFSLQLFGRSWTSVFRREEGSDKMEDGIKYLLLHKLPLWWNHAPILFGLQLWLCPVPHHSSLVTWVLLCHAHHLLPSSLLPGNQILRGI